MKTKKLNLKELKVESFVTSLDSTNAQTMKGGSSFSGADANAVLVTALVVAGGVGVSIGVAVNAVIKAAK